MHNLPQVMMQQKPHNTALLNYWAPKLSTHHWVNVEESKSINNLKMC